MAAFSIDGFKGGEIDWPAAGAYGTAVESA